MENKNTRQGNNPENSNEDNGVMEKIGQSMNNVVDAVTGENQNNDQQRDRNNNNRR